jgi:hypothetical protein
MSGFGNTHAFVTSAVRNTFTGSDIVTMGIATSPSCVHSARLRCKSALRWMEAEAAVLAVVAFTMRLAE